MLVNNPTKNPLPNTVIDRSSSNRIFLISQSDNVGEIKQILLAAAVSNGWISLLVNINASVFAGLILLTAEFGALESIYFLLLQASVVIACTIVFLYLQIRINLKKSVHSKIAERLLTFADLLAMAGWSFGTLLFVTPDSYQRSLLIIVLLTAAGIASATLNSRLLPSLIIGRLCLFLPATIYFSIEQPPFWGLLLCCLVFATSVSIGIGYAIHVQHINEANLTFKLRNSSILLEQQAFSLERSMHAENEAQRKLLEETKLRERFLHSIGHDLNQPLGALGLYLHSLEHLNLSRETSEIVSAARHSLGSARNLVKNVSQLAWLENELPNAQIGPIDLSELLNRIADDFQTVAADAGINFTRVPTSVSLMADPDFLERILRNLVQNAVQYSSGGKILLGVRRRSNGFAEIIVADNGAGISTEHQMEVFEAFYQIDAHKDRRHGNVGLGLSIVKDLTSAIEGQITLKSRAGNGAMFGVILPLADPRGTNTESSSKLKADKPRTNSSTKVQKTILLVDDQRTYINSVSAMLSNLGFRVDSACTSLEIASLNSTKIAAFNFLIIDFDLGDGLTAFDVLDRLEGTQVPPFLVISQHDDPDMVLNIKKMNGRFLKKPFTQEALSQSLGMITR